MMEYKTLKLDEEAKVCYVDGEEVIVTPREYYLLSTMLTNIGKIFSRAELIDGKKVSERSVDVSITRLRKKLKQYGENIIARRGFGYGFCPDSESSC